MEELLSKVEQAPAVMVIEFGVTRQPQSYQSVRCGVTMPVFVYPGDPVEEMLRAKMVEAKLAVRSQVDDEYEQGYEQPAVYSREQRFAAMVVRDEKLVVLLPHKAKESLTEGWRTCRTEFTEHRLSFVVRKVNEEYPHYVVIDCTDGDFSKLPPLESFEVWRYSTRVRDTTPQMWVLVKDGAIPPAKEEYPGYWNMTSYFRLYDEDFVAELAAKAKKDKSLFFDCASGDFSQVPQPPVVEPEPEETVLDEDEGQEKDGQEDDDD